MGLGVALKLLAAHLVEGDLGPGGEIAIRVDRTLTRDATGTLVMLELEAMGRDFVLRHHMSRRRIEQVRAGGIISLTRRSAQPRGTREVPGA